MAFDTNNPADVYGAQRRNALATLTGPAPMLRPMQATRNARLTAQGYEGPLLGSPELMAARQAGQHPIMDWRQSQPQWQGPHAGGPPPLWQGGYGGPVGQWGGGQAGPYGGFIPPNYEAPHPPMLAPRPTFYGGSAPAQNALASLSFARRPMQLPRK